MVVDMKQAMLVSSSLPVFALSREGAVVQARARKRLGTVPTRKVVERASFLSSHLAFKLIAKTNGSPDGLGVNGFKRESMSCIS
jgi:hypothetical protein